MSTSVAAMAATTAALAQDQSAATITEIVVTANRTESLASKTPIALTAVTGENLKAKGVTNPTLLAQTVPNLSIDRTGGLQITIRGVTSTDNSEKGDPSAAFLLDGIYIARPQAQEVSFFDIDRVEVLRGPQGTLYGRNTTAGVVNVISAKPKFTFGASADVTLGNYGATQVEGMANLPVNDVLAVRVAGNYDARDSYITQGVPQPVGLPKDKKNTSGRVSVLYRPNDQLNFLFKADASTIRGVQNNVLISNFYQLPFLAPADGAGGVAPPHVHHSVSEQLQKNYADVGPSSENDKTWGVTGELNWNFANHLTFTWLGGYRSFNRENDITTLAGSAYVSPTVQNPLTVRTTFGGNYNEVSQEARFAYASDKLKAQAGLYYFREHYGVDWIIHGLLSPTPGTPGYIFAFPESPGGSQSFGVFGQANYSLTDRWRVMAGVRQTRDEKFRHGATLVHSDFGQPFDPATDSLNDARIKTQKMTWKVGTDYDLTDRTMLFATLATGYKGGGFNDGCAAGSSQCLHPLPTAAILYQPETLTSYELGVKSKLLDNTLRLNASYFHYDYNNLQLTQVSDICGGPCQITTNAAAARIDGVEIEGLYLLSANNRFDFSATWLDARYSDWPIVPGFNFARAKLDRSPDVTLSAGYTYTQPLPNGAVLTANVGTRYSAKYALIATAMRAQFWQPSFTKSDLSLTYNAAHDAWYVQGYVRNIENKVNVTSVSLSALFPNLNDGIASFGDPRTYGVRLGARF